MNMKPEYGARFFLDCKKDWFVTNLFMSLLLEMRLEDAAAGASMVPSCLTADGVCCCSFPKLNDFLLPKHLAGPCLCPAGGELLAGREAGVQPTPLHPPAKHTEAELEGKKTLGSTWKYAVKARKSVPCQASERCCVFKVCEILGLGTM